MSVHLNRACPLCPPLRHFGRVSKKERKRLLRNGWRCDETWYPPTWPHGEHETYNRGCRCQMCVDHEAHRIETGLIE